MVGSGRRGRRLTAAPVVRPRRRHRPVPYRRAARWRVPPAVDTCHCSPAAGPATPGGTKGERRFRSGPIRPNGRPPTGTIGNISRVWRQQAELRPHSQDRVLRGSPREPRGLCGEGLRAGCAEHPRGYRSAVDFGQVLQPPHGAESLLERARAIQVAEQSALDVDATARSTMCVALGPCQLGVSGARTRSRTAARDLLRERARPSGVGLFQMLQGRQFLDGLAGLGLGQAEFIQALKVEPELGARSEEMRQAQGGVPGDGALAVQNPVTRFVGTLSRRASSAALIFRASSSSARCSPG